MSDWEVELGKVVNNRKVSRKLNDSPIKEEIKGEIRKYFARNENTTYQNL